MPPAFYTEADHVPQKQTTWDVIRDFTHGEALKHRLHVLTFRALVFAEKHREKIVFSEAVLFSKICAPFPSNKSLFFDYVPNNVGSFLSNVPQLNPHGLPNQTHGNAASQDQQQAVMVLPDPNQSPRGNSNLQRSALDMQHYASQDQQAVMVAGMRMQIFVKTTEGKTIILDVEGAETIYNIKGKIHRKEGIPVKKQSLHFVGKELNDDKTVAEYKIPQYSTLGMFVRLLGGSGTSKCEGRERFYECACGRPLTVYEKFSNNPLCPTCAKKKNSGGRKVDTNKRKDTKNTKKGVKGKKTGK